MGERRSGPRNPALDARRDGAPGGGRRQVAAAVTVAAAVLVTGVAVPLLAVRAVRGEGDGVAPPLAILLPLAVLALASALLAFYRLALTAAASSAPVSPAPSPSSRGTDSALAADLSPRTVVQRRAAPTPADPAAPAPAESRPRDRGSEEAPARASDKAVTSGRRDAPAVARSAPRKAADRRPSPARQRRERPAAVEPAPPDVAEPLDTVEERCEIVWWHGARRGGFEARTTGGDGGTRVVERSQMIAWKDATPPPPDEPARTVHAALVARLAAAGWEVGEPGDAWYASRLSRRTAVVARPSRSSVRMGRRRRTQPPAR